MKTDLFSVTAPRRVKTTYSKLSKQKKEIGGPLSERDQQCLDDATTELTKLAETGKSCDHGTIGDRWTYGVLFEALKSKKGVWVLCMHKMNKRSISIEDAEKFSAIEEMYPETGYDIL